MTAFFDISEMESLMVLGIWMAGDDETVTGWPEDMLECMCDESDPDCTVCPDD